MSLIVKQEFFNDGRLKSSKQFNGASLWGGQVTCSQGGIESLVVKYENRECGTSFCSNGPGYLREETYFNPDFPKSSVFHSFYGCWIYTTETTLSGKRIQLRTKFSRDQLFPEVPDFVEHLEQRREKLLNIGKRVVYDLDAELSFCSPSGIDLPFLPDDLNQFQHANGNPSFYGYVWEEGGRYWWNDETAVFWENGSLRATCCWIRHGIRGTRSCFSKDGQLAVEQFFGATGWDRGSWVNRFYSNDGTSPGVARVEVFKNFDLIFAVDNPTFAHFAEDYELNRYTFPEYLNLEPINQ